MSIKQGLFSLEKYLNALHGDYKSTQTKTYTKVIRSETDPNIGIGVLDGKVLFSLKGIAGFSDEDLNAIEFRVTPGDGPTKVNIYYPSSDRGTSLGTLQGTTKPVKEKPDQNYLKLRKSKY